MELGLGLMLYYGFDAAESSNLNFLVHLTQKLSTRGPNVIGFNVKLFNHFILVTSQKSEKTI